MIEGYLEGRRSLKPQTAWETVTHREREILKLIAEGYRNKKIAEYLCISVKTVEKHRANLMEKLDLHNVQALTTFAIEKGVRRSIGYNSRLLKNAHVLRFPHPSPCRARGRLIAAYAQVRLGRLTNSPAWQKSLLIRRDATLRIWEPCIWAFLSSLGKHIFSASR